jgi:hypothetical protein
MKQVEVVQLIGVLVVLVRGMMVHILTVVLALNTVAVAVVLLVVILLAMVVRVL